MDYFNNKESETQRVFAAQRDALFAPVVDRLVRKRVTPNQITCLGIGLLLIACLLSQKNAIFAGILITLYVLCDGLDGPLARRLGTAHQGGSLVDIVADQLGVVFLSAAATYHLGAWAPAMVVFASAYLVFIGLAVYANGIDVPLWKFIRAKYFFFILYVISLYAGEDYISNFSAIFAVYYCVMSCDALRRIYAYHGKKKHDKTAEDAPAESARAKSTALEPDHQN